jgi:hypothetical protein
MKVWQPMQVKLVGNVKDVVRAAVGSGPNLPL